MLPRVILHNVVSLDGRIDGFVPNLGQYYGLVATWEEDATLAGSETILKSAGAEATAMEEVDPELPKADPGDRRVLLVVPDSRGRIRGWNWLRRQPYWRDAVVLCSRSTPSEHLEYLRARRVEYIVAGDDRVDLRAALEELNARCGVATVRADSGGTLNGVLLRAGLVDEVSVVVHPALVGGEVSRSIFRAADLPAGAGVISLELIHLERLEGDTVWLRYRVVR